MLNDEEELNLSTQNTRPCSPEVTTVNTDPVPCIDDTLKSSPSPLPTEQNGVEIADSFTFNCSKDDYSAQIQKDNHQNRNGNIVIGSSININEPTKETNQATENKNVSNCETRNEASFSADDSESPEVDPGEPIEKETLTSHESGSGVDSVDLNDFGNLTDTCQEGEYLEDATIGNEKMEQTSGDSEKVAAVDKLADEQLSHTDNVESQSNSNDFSLIKTGEPIDKPDISASNGHEYSPDGEHLSDNEEDAVAEIEKAAINEGSGFFGDTLLKLSKSVSPPATLSFDFKAPKPSTRSKFASLNNLANRLLETKSKDLAPLTSSSMSDLDKYAEHFPHLQKNTSSTDGLNSSHSDDFDAYDAVKLEAACLDGSVDEELSQTNTQPRSYEELQKLVKKLEYELDVANGTIKHVYEESTKKLHAVSMQYETKISHIDKRFIECIKEKDIMKSHLDECMDARRKLQSNKESLIKNLSNQADENERLRSKLNMSTEDCVKLKKDLDLRTAELVDARKSVKKCQDDLSSASIKVQWANSKLKSECEAHQSTRGKLAGMDAKVREAKEEANIIRANCQAMIDKYQNSEEIQSNALSSKLEKLEGEFADLNTQYEMMRSKYENKCVDYEDANRHLEQIKDQLFEKEADYRRVLQESKAQESDKNKLANQLEDLDEQLNSYNELKAELKNAYHNNQTLDNELIAMRERVETVEKCNKELNGKEKGNLDYFQKISGKNAELQLEVNSLKMECEGNNRSIQTLTEQHNELKIKYSDISMKYSEQVGESTSSISDLDAKIKELEQCKSDLETQVHDLKNESVVAKRKHQADNKDLIRQIEQFRKQFERQEESMRRTESINSLESGGGDRPVRSGASSEAGDSASVSNDSGATMSLDNARILLIERLCSLQKVLAKRQEKIEFYESHVSTLTKDVSKKSKIIQNLLLRVETGERTKLASEAYKRSKPSTSASEGFWGSSSNGMTLKLSTEINEKLQQVLEDTLFKNITLKENIKTLGDEIDRLNSRK